MSRTSTSSRYVYSLRCVSVVNLQSLPLSISCPLSICQSAEMLTAAACTGNFTWCLSASQLRCSVVLLVTCRDVCLYVLMNTEYWVRAESREENSNQRGPAENRYHTVQRTWPYLPACLLPHGFVIMPVSDCHGVPQKHCHKWTSLHWLWHMQLVKNFSSAVVNLSVMPTSGATFGLLHGTGKLCCYLCVCVM